MLEALLGIVVTLQVALIGWILYHSSQCSAFHERMASLEADMKRVKEDISAPETGLRANIHNLRSRITPVVLEHERRKDGR